MGFYDITWSTFWSNMLPPRKRLTRFIAWGEVLMRPIRWLHDLLFTDYRLGGTYTAYSNVATYTIGDKVKWTNNSIYICIADTTAGILPNNITYWYLVAPDSTGMTARAAYTGQKLLLEYALNNFYSTTFEQPPTQSEIYVETNVTDVYPFSVGENATDTSAAASSGKYAVDFVGESYTYGTISLTINVPDTVLATLVNGDSAPYPLGKAAVLTYAYRLIFAGIKAEVVGY